jgi:hypothetical protein
LYRIGELEQRQRNCIIQNEDDLRIVNKLIQYLDSIEYYTDPDSGITKWGVYTNSGTDDPNPSVGPVNSRPDVFIAGRQFPVPNVDFVGLTLGLTELQALAQPAVGGKEWTSSGREGYLIVFKVTGGVTSYDLYTVKNVTSPPGSCGTDITANGQKTGPKKPISHRSSSLAETS